MTRVAAVNIRSEASVRESLASWRRKEDYRRARWHYYQSVPQTAENKELRAKWYRLLVEAKWYVERREQQLAKLSGSKPKFIRLHAPMSRSFGALGSTRAGVGHYTAGPRDTSDRHGVALFAEYNRQHRAAGWGAIGYHLAILSSGNVLLLRPTSWKGSHTAGQNTGRIGIVVAGGPGQRMTAAQRSTLTWLKNHGHTGAMPSSHRLPVGWHRGFRVHSDLGSTACPGAYKSDYRKIA